MYKLLQIYFLLFLLNISIIICRNHLISIKDDRRPSIPLSHFGYNANGVLYLEIDRFNVSNSIGSQFGFSLDHSTSGSVASFMESSYQRCFLDEHTISTLLLRYDWINKTMAIETIGSAMRGLLIYKGLNFSSENNAKRLGTFNMTDEVQIKLENNLIKLFAILLNKSEANDIANQILRSVKKSSLINSIRRKALLNVVNMIDFKDIRNNANVVSDLKMILIMAKETLGPGFSPHMETLWNKLHDPIIFHVDLPLKLLIEFPTSSEEGDYDLYFHNCGPAKMSRVAVNFKMNLIEKNWNSYLSVGDQPLPLLFFIMCSSYVLLSVIWSLRLFTSEHMVFKIHYLMLVLLIMKSLSLFFHGINYYELGRNGVHEQGWAIMFYITHLLKGALLFITVILIGAGWAFIKHMLTGKEKKVFMIVIPLQILANVATIIISESEESTARILTWRNIFLLVDLICCGAILFPVIWSIKHLTEAANIDGKQAQNLDKLRLFRHFYILIICYIYSTRIIVFLLIITVSFKLTWLEYLFRELSTIFFMVVVGYKFRPVSDNPYLLVPLDEDNITEQEQIEHAWLQSGVTVGVTKIHQMSTLDSDSDEDDTVYEMTPKSNPDRRPLIDNGNSFVHTSRL